MSACNHTVVSKTTLLLLLLSLVVIVRIQPAAECY